jgi:hypothetical protein
MLPRWLVLLRLRVLWLYEKESLCQKAQYSGLWDRSDLLYKLWQEGLGDCIITVLLGEFNKMVKAISFLHAL